MLRRTLAEEGAAGLYRGCLPTLLVRGFFFAVCACCLFAGSAQFCWGVVAV
jgi:hypothetical protein